jgi:lipopolysaccharide export system protein LptA
MKKLWTILAVAGCGFALLAQTNLTSIAKPERAPTLIDADSLEFKLESLSAVYTGNVKVNDPDLQLTCEMLTARFRTNNSRLEIESIIAETNVVIDAIDWEGRTNHATADKLVYSHLSVDGVTNQTLELTGDPKLSNPLGGLSGEIIFVDLVKGKVFAKNQSTSIKSDGVRSFGEEIEGKKKQPADGQTSPETPK